MGYINFLSTILAFLLTILSDFVCYGKSKFDLNVLEQAKKSVVSVDRKIAVTAYTLPYNFDGNGVVIDKQSGYILTSSIVVGPVMIGTYTVGFFNGTEAEAKVMYYDPWLDYAILKVDPLVIPKQIREIKLSNTPSVVGQSIFTIASKKNQKPTVHFGTIADTNANITWTMPQHFICVSTTTKTAAVGSLIFNKLGEGIALNCAGSDTINVGLHLNYIHYGLSALKQQKTPCRKHIGALLTTYTLDDAMCYDHLSPASQKEYIKQFPNAQNKILQVESVLDDTPATEKLLPGDLIWAINGRLIGPNLTDFDIAINKADKDYISLKIFRNGSFHDITISLYNLEDHRVTRIVQFGGAVFFETDDFSSKLGGVAPKTLACCIAQQNTIFKANLSTIDNLAILGIAMLAINGEPVHTLDALVNLIPTLIQQKYFTIEYINCIHKNHGQWVSYGHDRCKENVTYDTNLEPPKLWIWNGIESQWIENKI